MPIDTVFVRAIRLPASIGTLPWEKEQLQTIEVDVHVQVDTKRLLATGQLHEGIDFCAVMQGVTSVVQQGHVDLVEVLADRIANHLLCLDGALAVEVEVRKHNAEVENAQCMGVRVMRKREASA